MRRVLVSDATRRLPEGYDVATHFTPTYAPWDQRMCVVPGGDIFRAVSSGRADVVTGTVDTFTERGIRLADGHEIDADVVVAATGLEVLALGDMQVVVDGEVLAPGERIVYKSVLLSDVPNFAYVFGYTNASWTLKVDLACAWICRVIEHMRRTGATTVVATVDDPAMPTRSMLDLAAGYLLRRRGPHPPTGEWGVVGAEELPRRCPAPAARSDRRRRAAVLQRGQGVATGCLTAATSTGMPVSCNMPLTGSNDPAPLGPSRFTLTPGWACAFGMPAVVWLPKPWVIATTPGRRLGRSAPVRGWWRARW